MSWGTVEAEREVTEWLLALPGGTFGHVRFYVDLLADQAVGIVSLGGPAGTGKSVLALAAGLDAVLEQRTHNRVIVFRPIFPVGGQDLGYLPGSETEKMMPWGAAVTDALEAIAGSAVIDEVFGRGLLEVLPLMLAGDDQGAMLKLHTEPEPAKVERRAVPAPAEPAQAEAAAKKKAKAPEAPGKPGKAAPAQKTAKVEKSAESGKAGKEEAGKGGVIGSFLKKLIPGSDTARKK